MVTAYFDPMLPQYVELLRAAAGVGSVVILLATPSDGYLEPRARAELAASLSFVEAVVISAGDLASEIAVLAPSERLALQDQEQQLRGEFLIHVRERARQG